MSWVNEGVQTIAYARYRSRDVQQNTRDRWMHARSRLDARPARLRP